METTKNNTTSCQQEMSARKSLLIWLHPAGAVAVIPAVQSMVTISKIEIGKGWQNSSITAEHCL
jgi:hypothetical protein